MPAQAGIHLRFRWQAKENLDSGLRRHDERKSPLRVDEFRTCRLEPKVIKFRATEPRSLPGRLALAHARRRVGSKSFRSGAGVNRAAGVKSPPGAPAMRFVDLQYLASAGRR